MEKNFNLGDMVYFEESWSGMILNGIIMEIDNNYVRLSNGYTSNIDTIFNTYEECLKCLNEKSRIKIDAYKSEVTDIKELIIFMYNHNVSICEEYTNYEARKAVEELSKELLNIDLKY